MIHSNNGILALKRNKLPNHENTWKTLKCILLSKRNTSETATHHTIPTICDILENKTMEPVKISEIPSCYVGKTDE